MRLVALRAQHAQPRVDEGGARRRRTTRDGGGVVTVLILLRVAQAERCGEARHDAPVDLAERGIAEAAEIGAAVLAIAVEQIARHRRVGGAGRRTDQVTRRGRPVDADRSPDDLLAEAVETSDVAERPRAVRGEPHLLAILVLPRRDVLRRLDRQAGIVAVVLRIPVPEPPRADRCQRRETEVPVGDRADPAFVGVDAERPVDVGDPVVGIGAGGRIAELRGEPARSAELTVGGAQRGAGAQIDLAAAIGLEVGEVGDEPHLDGVIGLEQQLPAHGLRAQRVGVATGAEIVDHAVATGRH